MLHWLWRRIGALRPRRHEFQFSLRTLLLAMLLAALGLAWWLDHRRMDARIQRLENRLFPPPTAVAGASWGVEQATGPPNTSGSGDIVTAWASGTPDGQQEWLLLKYAKPVQPSAVVIHETYNPGALIKVSVFDPDGKEVIVWTGVDPTPPTSPRGVSTIPIKVDFKTSRVKLYFDSPKFPGWNEIDAVGLQYWWGRTLWAVEAEASSSFAERNAQPSGFSPYPQSTVNRLSR